jgi:F420-dependent oxidoreductase-like protein
MSDPDDGGRQRVRLGLLAWPQYTDWRSLQEVGTRADRLGYDSLWTWDHLYPIVGSPAGPIFEGYMTLGGWAMVTERVKLGLMVGANTFRNPTLVVKMATTLDHMSNGRAVLGIGAAWFETEHIAFGIDFGSGFAERCDRLHEAVEIMRGMLDGTEPSGRGRVYHAKRVRNDPPPVQERLPILIGGAGEQKTLRTVAKYADAWNVGGNVERVRHKDEVLRRWCEQFGRDEAEIERTLQGGAVVIRDTVEEAKRVRDEIGRRNGGWEGPEFYGTPDMVVEKFAPYLEIGFWHIYFDAPAPFDDETIERLVTEVKPRLAQASPVPAGTAG